jgi:hypothetical protein
VHIWNDVLVAPSFSVFDRCNFVANNSTTVPRRGGPRKAGIVAITAHQVGSNAFFKNCKFQDNDGIDVETSNAATAWSTKPPLAMFEHTDLPDPSDADNETRLDTPQEVKNSMLSLEDDELLQIQQVLLQLACWPVHVAWFARCTIELLCRM